MPTQSKSTTLNQPSIDPTPIFEYFRGSYGSELLTAAVAHFNLFGHLAEGPVSFDELRSKLELEVRPTVVLLTALRAFGLIAKNAEQAFELTELATEHLVPDTYFGVNDYIGLAAQSPGVLEMVARLRTNRPAGSSELEGAAFIFREGIESAMEQESTARHFTLALSGRAKNVAPVLGEKASMDGVTTVLDIGGGTGIYSIALLQRNPNLKAIVFDRPEVLKVASELAAEYEVDDRLEFRSGDMFVDELAQGCEAILLSNILHDWDVPECQQLVTRCAEALPAGGRLLIHDVFLHDELDGPLPIALYSAALFSLTEGRAYSVAEYSSWMKSAGLNPGPVIPTLVHCGILTGVKP